LSRAAVEARAVVRADEDGAMKDALAQVGAKVRAGRSERVDLPAGAGDEPPRLGLARDVEGQQVAVRELLRPADRDEAVLLHTVDANAAVAAALFVGPPRSRKPRQVDATRWSTRRSCSFCAWSPSQVRKPRPVFVPSSPR